MADWMPFYTGKWIYGSTCLHTTAQRGVWASLMALANETKLRDGTLRHDVGKPMARDYISAVLHIDKKELDESIEFFGKDKNADDGKGRIEIWEDGTIELTNFKKLLQRMSGGKKEKKVKTEEQRDNITVSSVALKPHLGVKGLHCADKRNLDNKTREFVEGHIVDKETGEIL